MTTLFLLDSVEAARTLMRSHGLRGDYRVLSTNYAVVGYLRARGVACQDFSDFIDAAQGRGAIATASRQLQDCLGRLDAGVGRRLCGEAGLPDVPIFHSLFKYPWEYVLSGLILFRQVLAGVLEGGAISKVHYFYEATLSDHPVFSCVDAARALCKGRGVSFVATAYSRGARELLKRARLLLVFAGVALRQPSKLLRAVRERFARPNERGLRLGEGARLALVFEPVRQFGAALQARGLQVFAVPRLGVRKVADVPVRPAAEAAAKACESARNWLRNGPRESGDETDVRVVEFLADRAVELLLPAIYISHVIRRHPIAVAAWSSPLVLEMAPNLVLDVLLVAGVTVLGRQHGSCYIDQDMGDKHFDSDFNRCTHFLSFGATREEFASCYGERPTRCAIVPAGRPAPAAEASAQPIDIAFPILNCIPLSSFGRLEWDLVHRQRVTLQAIHARPDLSSIVKPMLHFSEDDFSQMETLRELRHSRIVRATWTDFLKLYRPRLVVIEMISTPLYEVLHLDVDIFVMLCDIAPISRAALDALAKRVHIFATVEDMAAAIAAYDKAPLPRLRDDEFYRRYVNRGSFDSALAAVGL